MKKFICVMLTLAMMLSLLSGMTVNVGAAGEVIFSQAEEVQVGSKAVSNWPYTNFYFSYTDDVKVGAVFECDLRVDDINALKTIEAAGNNLKFYIKPNGNSIATVNLMSSDFNDSNIAHVSVTVTSAITTDITRVLVQAYGKNCTAMVYISNSAQG